MARGFRSILCLCLVASLLVNAFCAPQSGRPKKDRYRPYRDDFDANDPDDLQKSESRPTSSTASPGDDEDDFGEMQASPTSGGGSNIISLLNLATALFPGSGSSGANIAIRNLIRQNLQRYQQPVNIRRQDIAKNVIDIDDVPAKPPPFQRQEDEDHDDSDDDDDDDDDSDSHDSVSEEDNDAAEESIENNNKDENDKASKQDSNGNDDDDDGSDYSDEPEGDGQGGGILGLLAGLSGGEDGSDLGTLLATVSQILGDLSGGDGFDLNAIIASGFGLLVGLLSQGEENPGTVISGYLLASLDSITGGGANNNGAFIGNFLSNLIKGASASGSSSSSGQESSDPPMSPLWTLKLAILRAFLQFGTSILGLASSSSSTASSL